MEHLSAFLPMEQRQALARGETLPERGHGSALFADISGFTPLAEALVRSFGAQRGAEEMNAHLNEIWGALIAHVDRFAGSVIGFSGDAITCWFEADDGAAAAACGLAMQAGLRTIASIAIPHEEPITINVKVAIAVGPVQRYVVGDPAIQRFAVAVGPTMARMAAIEGVAARGEVLLDEAAAAVLGDRLRVGDRRVAADGTGCVLVTAIDPPAITPWPRIDETALPEAELRTWVLPAVRERIGGSAAGLQAELRPVVALLLRFSGVLGDDPATRLATWIAWVQRTLVARGGTLIDITFGDKGSYLLAVFGTPIAHEDDAVRAAAAAIDLRDGAAGAGGQVDGIGVSSGRMCTGVFGGPTQRAFGVQGLDVTVAARLMQTAGPARIVVSDRVARAVGRRFALSALGAISVKGISTPIDVHELVAAADADPAPPPGGQRAPLPIVGRDAELAVLRDGLTAVAGGERRSALVIAEAGAGKTRLVDEIADHARGDGFEVLRGTGDTLAHAVPYAVWRPIVGTVLGLDRPGGTGAWRTGAPPTADEVVARLSACLPHEDPDRFALLDPVLPVAIPESAATAAMIPEARQERTLDLLARLLEAGRGDRPRLLAIDDAQWLDASSLALLDRIIRSAPRTLTIVAARRGEAETEMRTLTDGAPVIELTHLGRDAARSVVAGALGLRDLPDAVARFIDERAEGHPFFSLEIGFALRDAGLLEVVDGTARVRGVADLATLEFPETIEGVIGVRLDRLRPDAQGLLKVCSVLGGSFTPDVLAEVDPVHPPGEVRRILDELEAVDLVVGESRARTGASPYEFRHVLIRGAVYQRLLYAQRRELHTRAAHHFERAGAIAGVVPHGILAHHWEAAADPGRAIEHLDAAGSDALRDGAFREAADFLDRACAIAAGRGATTADAASEPVAVAPERLATWEWQSAQAHYRLGDLDESRALAEAAVGVLDRPAPVGGLGLALGAGGQVATQLLHRLRPGRYLDRAPGPDRERLRRAVRAHFNLAEVYYLASLPGRSAYAALRGLNLAEWAGPSYELVEAYGAITIISGLLGRHGLADRYARLGLATAALVEAPAARAIILHQSSLYRSGVGPGERVLADFEEAFDIFRTIGDKGRYRDAIGLAGIAAHLYGRPALAERLLEELRAGIGERERSLAGVWSTIWLGATALRRGDLDRAIRELERAATMQVETADATTVAAHGLLASAYLAADRPDAAIAEVDRARALIAATGGRASMHGVYDGYVALAQVSLASLVAAPDEAGRTVWRARSREAIGWLAAYARLFPIGRAGHGLAEGDLALVSGDPERARRAWVRALQTAEELDMRYEQAAAHARLAGVATVPEAARVEHARAAEALAETMGVPVPRPIIAGAAGAAA